MIIPNAKHNYKIIRILSRFGGPEVLEVDNEVKIPEISDNQVLVRVMYAGVNPVETYIREGQYSRYVNGMYRTRIRCTIAPLLFRLPDLPYTPGSDAAGYVHQAGKNVTGLKVITDSEVILNFPRGSSIF